MVTVRKLLPVNEASRRGLGEIRNCRYSTNILLVRCYQWSSALYDTYAVQIRPSTLLEIRLGHNPTLVAQGNNS